MPSPTSATPAADYLSYSERVDLVVACIREDGFEAANYQGFGVYVEHGPGQEDVATRVEGQCWEEVEARFPAPPPLTLEEHYFYMLDVAACLRDLGFDIPDAPTLETYVDQAESQTVSEDFWDPYAYLSRRGVDTYALQRESCPPAPWAR